MSSCRRELTQGLGPLTNIKIALATIDRGRHKHSSVANPLSARTWSINNNFYRNPYLELLWLKCYLTWATALNSYSIKRPKSWLIPSLHAQEQFWALLQTICMTKLFLQPCDVHSDQTGCESHFELQHRTNFIELIFTESWPASYSLGSPQQWWWL
jgi:hypothetical protein